MAAIGQLEPMLHRDEGEPNTLPGQFALPGFDAVVTFTEFESKVMQSLEVAPFAIHVIPPGCHAERYASIEQEDARRAAGLPERETVGFVGRLTPYKGVDTVLAAVPGLLTSDPTSQSSSPAQVTAGPSSNCMSSD